MLKKPSLMSARCILPLLGAALACISMAASPPAGAQFSDDFVTAPVSGTAFDVIDYSGISDLSLYPEDEFPYPRNPDGSTYDRIIIRYKEGSAERMDPCQVKIAPLSVDDMFIVHFSGFYDFSNFNPDPVELKHVRRLPSGADLMMTSRPLSEGELVHMLRTIVRDAEYRGRADQLEYVGADLREGGDVDTVEDLDCSNVEAPFPSPPGFPPDIPLPGWPEPDEPVSDEEIETKINFDGISNPGQYAPDRAFPYDRDYDSRLYSRLLVRYKDGTEEGEDIEGAVEDLVGALDLTALSLVHYYGGGALDVPMPDIERVRRRADGADLFMASRDLSEAEAVMLMRAFAEHPAVSSVELDLSSGRDFYPGAYPIPVHINFSGFSNFGPYAENPEEWRYDRPAFNGRQYDRFIVGYKDGVITKADPVRIEALRDSFEHLAAFIGSRVDERSGSVGIRHVRRLATGADLFTVSRGVTEYDMFLLLSTIAQDADRKGLGIEYLELDLTRQPAAVASDELRANQYVLGTAVGGIGAERAWDRATGEGVVVAVVDTGITPHHDLDAHVLPGYDFVSSPLEARDYDGGRDPDPEDLGDYFYPGECANMPGQSRHSSWHGTATAGAIAAVAGNGLGVAGAAPGARIVPVRVLGRCGGLDSDIAEAVIWAAGGDVPGVPANPHPAEVINLGLGSRSPKCPITYQAAIDTAVALGATVVVAAGNDGGDVSGFAPANCRNVIVAAASDSGGARAGFSNRGAGVDVSAPGDAIAVLSDTGIDPRAQAGYGRKSGTSLAAAHVSATVALMQSAAAMPLAPARVESVLKATSAPLVGDCEDGCGAGIIDAEAAVDAAAADAGG